MPIPAVMRSVDPGVPGSQPVPPTRVHWQRTYVSITGSNGQGDEIPLTGFVSKDWPTIVMQAGATGLDTPPYTLHFDESPNLDGAIYRGARATEREIMIPVFVYGVDRKTVLDLKRQLVSALSPKNGYCVLKFQETGGQPRYLSAYYKAGMEGNEGTDASGFTWTTYGIQMTAMDPWYYADTLRVAQWQFGAGKPFFTSGQFLPFPLQSSLPESAQLPIINPGDVEAWPIWEITGPVTSFSLTDDLGNAFGISNSGTPVVASGRVLTVDTRPGFKTLKDDLGTNYFPQLDSNPVLWSVPAGNSFIHANVVGTDSAAVKLTLTPRYNSY